MIMKSIPLEEFFEGVDESEVKSLLDNMQIEKYPAKSIIIGPDDFTSHKIYHVKQGRIVRYYLSLSGRRFDVGQATAGGFFGFNWVLSRVQQRNLVEAVEDSVLGAITKDQFIPFLMSHPDLMLRVLEYEVNTRTFLEERLMDRFFNSDTVLIANFIVSNADPITGVLADFTHEQISNIIGASRQTVTTLLNRMQKQRLLLIDKKYIQILNRPGLEKIING